MVLAISISWILARKVYVKLARKVCIKLARKICVKLELRSDTPNNHHLLDDIKPNVIIG
jgi:hypothetical protein